MLVKRKGNVQDNLVSPVRYPVKGRQGNGVLNPFKGSRVSHYVRSNEKKLNLKKIGFKTHTQKKIHD